jgi:aryl-alcohol dehydrogenase-like predicted oxidoreductase
MLKTVKLGKSGLTVTELGLGCLPMGPVRAGLSPEEGGRVVRAALAAGITFIDTAAFYETYDHIRLGVQGSDGNPVIATKTRAEDEAGAAADLETARRKLGRSALDIVHIHAARTERPFDERAGAIAYLRRERDAGRIRAIGVATHRVSVVRQAARQGWLDVVHPLINMAGLGIIDGTAEEMLEAIAEAHSAGLGVYAMKSLGGGNLIEERAEALEFVRSRPYIDALVVGMVTTAEVEFNTRYFRGDPMPEPLAAKTGKHTKRLHVLPFCQGCGRCVEACVNNALALSEEEGRPVVDREACVLCGYCAPACPMFAIRIA